MKTKDYIIAEKQDINVLKEGVFVGERALFATESAEIYNSVFRDGESPLKESRDISLFDCLFEWKYPLWYCKRIKVQGGVLSESARSGIWYTEDIEMQDTVIDAPKTFRRSKKIDLSNVTLAFAEETMWNCSDIRLKDVTVRGNYFGMNSENIYAEGLSVSGNYAFDGAKRVEIRGARLISKDAFWNCEDVAVYDSLIVGEYLGWNSKNVKFVNCTIESNQGMCYMDNVILENCKLINTDLAFEYSSVDADVHSHIVSVKNTSSGRVVADSIGEIIMEENRVDTSKSIISVRERNEI